MPVQAAHVRYRRTIADLSIFCASVQMAPMAIGRIAMRYRQVECSPPGSLKVTIDKNYGTDRWLRLIVEVKP